MKGLVICFSHSGTTLKAAKTLAGMIESDIIEIREVKPRKGAIGFILNGMYATLKWPSRIMPLDLPAEKPAITVICGPIWAGRMSAPIRAFLLKYGGKLGEVAYLLTCGDKKNGYETAMDEMDVLLGKARKAGLCVPADSIERDAVSRMGPFIERIRR